MSTPAHHASGQQSIPTPMRICCAKFLTRTVMLLPPMLSAKTVRAPARSACLGGRCASICVTLSPDYYQACALQIGGGRASVVPARFLKHTLAAGTRRDHMG